MNAVILGAGVVGVQIAEQLINEGKNVVFIENDPDRAKFVSNHLDCIVVNDQGNDIDTLKKANIEKADFFISVTNSDEVNMITCGIVSSEFNVPVKIARVRNLGYSKSNIFENSFLGIDFIVNSELVTARAIANIIELGATSDVMLFEDTDVHIRNILIDKTSFFNGKNLKEIKQKLSDIKFLFAGIHRENDFLIPRGDTIIKENDTVYILANVKNSTKLFQRTGRIDEKILKIIIVGGGKIGSLVAKYLINIGRHVTILEKDYEKCKTLSAQFPQALVLNADISEGDIFEEEQLNTYDLILSTTDNHEVNLLTSVYAKSLGIKKTLSLVTKSNYMNIATQLGIDATISPKNCTVDAILKFIRRGNIKSVHTLFDGEAEVIEFVVDSNSSFIGNPIKEIEMPNNSLILSVNRDDESILPDGNFVIKEKDSLILIVHNDSIKKVEYLFNH